MLFVVAVLLKYFTRECLQIAMDDSVMRIKLHKLSAWIKRCFWLAFFDIIAEVAFSIFETFFLILLLSFGAHS